MPSRPVERVWRPAALALEVERHVRDALRAHAEPDTTQLQHRAQAVPHQHFGHTGN